MEEEKLVKQIRNKGDKDAANELINSYYKYIYLYVYKQVNNQEISKDITQEIFISMLRSITSYETKKASFKTWLYKIASNKIIDYYRSKNYKYTTKIVGIEEIDISDTKDIEAEIIHKEHIKEIIDILNNLESNIQQIFRLKVFGEMTFKEISEILEISESTVKTKYYSTIKKIKKELK